MANFTTHIAVGTVVSGGLSVVTLAADVVAPENLLAVTLAGVLGSVLPDIDLKDSRPSKAMFSGLGVFFSFAVLFNFAHKYSVVEMMILWLGTLVAVRYGLHAIFHRLAVHRGIWHSLLAGAFSAAATAVVFYHVLGRHEGVAWLGAGFMFIGFVTHLLLDEIYSVDVMDVRMKSSFGTAMKVFDSRYPQASVAMAAALVLAVVATPPTTTFVNGISSRPLWADLQSRMLPRDKWFGVYRPNRRAASVPAPTGSNMTTGSIPEKAAGAELAPAPAAAETVASEKKAD
ncbi:MAG: metal-dependent hydrolase [Hyphomicrobium sp.]